MEHPKLEPTTGAEGRATGKPDSDDGIDGEPNGNVRRIEARRRRQIEQAIRIAREHKSRHGG